MNLTLSGGRQGLSWSWTRGRTPDETDLLRKFRGWRLYVRDIAVSIPSNLQPHAYLCIGSAITSFSGWNSMITAYRNTSVAASRTVSRRFSVQCERALSRRLVRRGRLISNSVWCNDRPMPASLALFSCLTEKVRLECKPPPTAPDTRGGARCRNVVRVAPPPSLPSGTPGEKAIVLEAGLAVDERGPGEGFDPAARRFEDGLPGGCVPFHRRAEARVEVGFARGDHAEFERAAAFLALAHRIARKKLGEASAVFVRAAVDDDEPIRRRSARPDRFGLAAMAPAGRGARSASGVGDADRGT